MSAIITVDLNNFALEKPIVVLQGEQKTKYCGRVADIPEFIAHYASEIDVENVYLYGAADYATPIAENILAFAKKEYGINNLKVEVITQ